MNKICKKFGFSFVLMLCVSFLLPGTLLADVIKSQPISAYKWSGASCFSSYPIVDDGQGNNCVRNFVPLGTGLTGIPTGLNTNWDGDFSLTARAYLVEYTSAASTTYTGNWIRFDQAITAATDYEVVGTPSAYGGTYTSATTLDPTKYYGVVLSMNVSSGAFPYGTNSGAYGWECRNGTGFSCDTSFKAPYYVLQSTTAAYSSTHKSFPYNEMMATSTNVAFNFSYVALSGVTQYFLEIYDMTAGHDESFSGSLSPGVGTVVRNIILPTAHAYFWTVTLLNSSSDQVPQTSEQQYYFSVGVPLASTTVNSYYYSTSSRQFDTDGNLILPPTATTTGDIPSGLSAFSALGVVGTALCTRFPFSYLCDFGTFLGELDQTDQAPIISFSTPSLFGVQGSSSVVFINKSQIPADSPIKQVRMVIEYALWFLTPFVWVRLILRVI